MAEKGVKDDSKKEQESKLHFFLADSFMNLGNVYKAVGKYEKAELFYGKCGKHFQKAFLLKEDKKQKPETNDSPSKNNIKNNNTTTNDSTSTAVGKEEPKSKEQKKKEAELEAIRKIEEANRKMKEDISKFKEHEPNSGFFSNLFKKREQGSLNPEAQPVLEIGLPTNVEHKGHISFSSGAFQTRNLPPEYQTLFDNLNATLKSMGVSAITEKEAKLLLKSLPVIMNKSQQASSESTKKEVPRAHSANKNVSENDVISALKKELEEKKAEIDRLRTENNQLKNQFPNKDVISTSVETLSTSNTESAPLPPPPPPPAPKPSVPNPPREISRENSKSSIPEPPTKQALFDQIKGPSKLKHVDPQTMKEQTIDANDQNVLNIIAKALIERRQHIKDDNEDVEDENLDDWL